MIYRYLGKSGVVIYIPADSQREAEQLFDDCTHDMRKGKGEWKGFKTFAEAEQAA